MKASWVKDLLTALVAYVDLKTFFSPSLLLIDTLVKTKWLKYLFTVLMLLSIIVGWICGPIFFLFIVLKIVGHIEWSLVWVFSPLLLLIICSLFRWGVPFLLLAGMREDESDLGADEKLKN